MSDDEDRERDGASLADRLEVPMTFVPFAAGLGAAIPLWGVEAPMIFFATAAEVIALGAVAMALQGGIFRITGAASRRGWYATVTRATVLVAIGVGLAFAFGALVRGNPGDPHVAMTAGALAMGISAFAVHAIFGAPGTERSER